MKLLIKNGRVIHPVTETVLLQDILVENGRIDRKSVGQAYREIPPSGRPVAPGLLDMHSHPRAPGRPIRRTLLPAVPPPPGAG